MEGQDRQLLLKKWSAGKFLSLMGEISNVLDQTFSRLNGEPFSQEKLIGHMVSVICGKGPVLVRFVRETVEEKGLRDADILNWDMEDIVGVLTEALRLNMTESLQKKVMAAFRQVVPEPPAREPTIETPEATLVAASESSSDA